MAIRILWSYNEYAMKFVWSAGSGKRFSASSDAKAVPSQGFVAAISPANGFRRRREMVSALPAWIDGSCLVEWVRNGTPAVAFLYKESGAKVRRNGRREAHRGCEY
jgi:hypothetical protein